MSKLEKAMRYNNRENRKWILAGHADSYGGIQNRVSFYALEGSPPRGFIIDFKNYTIRLDMQGQHRKVFHD